MVDTVASVPPMLMLTMVMDMDVVMVMVDTDTHALMLVLTILARDLPNHLPTTVMDTVAVTDTVDTVERDLLSHTTDMVDTEDMEVTDMVVVMATAMDVKAYIQEAKRFHYLIFQIDF